MYIGIWQQICLIRGIFTGCS